MSAEREDVVERVMGLRGVAWTRDRLRTPAGVLVVLIAVGVLMRLYRFGSPILDQHSFRQTQTASTVWLWNRDGFDFFDYRVPMFGGGHWVFELPLYQTLVWVLQAPLGGIESAARIVSIGSYVAAAILLYLIAVRWTGSRVAALGAVAVFSFLPETVFYFRAVLVDTLFIATTLLAVYAATRLAARFTWAWYATLSLALLVSLLGKGTLVLATGAAVLVLGLRILLDRSVRLAAKLALVGTAVVCVAASAAWTRHADDLNLASGALTYSNGRDWFFGSTFTDPELYRIVGQRFLDNFGPIGLVLVGLGLAAIPAVRTGYRPEIAVTLVGAVLSVGIFANLNRVHDYYQLAYYVPLSLLAGLGLLTIYRAIARGDAAIARQAVAGVVLALVAVWSLATWSTYFAAGAVMTSIETQGRELAANTPDSRLLMIQENGDKNEPMLWYEARRTGWRVPTADPAQAEAIARDNRDIGAIVYLHGASPEPAFVPALARARGFAKSYESAGMTVYRRPGGGATS